MNLQFEKKKKAVSVKENRAQHNKIRYVCNNEKSNIALIKILYETH